MSESSSNPYSQATIEPNTNSKDAKEEEEETTLNQPAKGTYQSILRTTFFAEEDHVTFPNDDDRIRFSVSSSVRTTTIQTPSIQMEDNPPLSPNSNPPKSPTLNNNIAPSFDESEAQVRSSQNNVIPEESNMTPLQFENDELVLQLSPEHLSSNGSNGSNHDNNTTQASSPEERTEDFDFTVPISTQSEPETLTRSNFEEPEDKQELFVVQRKMLSQLGLLDDVNYFNMQSITLQDVPTRVPNSPNFSVAPRFVLYQQPDPTQRRSYAKEKRYVTPKPLVVCSKEVLKEEDKEKLPKIVSGTVTVELAVSDASNTEQTMKYMPNLLECTDGKSKALVDRNIAEFELTILGNSGPNKFQLVFTVSYSTEYGDSFVEQIVSQPFSVHANVPKTKRTEERAPTVRALQPKEGPADSDTEVWIKGSEFNSLVQVTFAHNQAKILSIENNLLTVLAPQLPGVQQDTSVPVSVANIYPTTTHHAVHKPRFTYYPGDSTNHIRNMATNNNNPTNNESFSNNNNPK